MENKPNETCLTTTPSLDDITSLVRGMRIQSVVQHSAGVYIFATGDGLQMSLDIRSTTGALHIELKRLARDGWRLVHRKKPPNGN